MQLVTSSHTYIETIQNKTKIINAELNNSPKHSHQMFKYKKKN